MKPASKRHTRIDRLEEGEWLHLLLTEVRADLANQPSPRAIERIRTRLLSEIQAPARAAA